MEIFNRMLGIEEIIKQKEARLDDLEIVWEGFRQFQEENIKLQRQCVEKIWTAGKLFKKPLDPLKVLTASETMMLFFVFGKKITGDVSGINVSGA